MDDFTVEHLRSFLVEWLRPEEREPFFAYATEAIADDPGLVEFGWDSLFTTFQRERGQQSPRFPTPKDPSE